MFNTHTNFWDRWHWDKPCKRHLIMGMIVVILHAGISQHNAFGIPSEPGIVDHVTIQHLGNGFAPSYTLPIYQIGDIRFMSAGVGLAERQASYPLFPLKLISAQADGAFVTGVTITISDPSGNEILTISEDQISGPWLFLDLKPGTYQITGVRKDGTPALKTITLSKGQTTGIHLHWPVQNRKG